MLPHWSEPPICSPQPCRSMQLHVVVGLQQHVAELGVGDALPLQASPHGIAVEHHVDREVLAHIAQELDRGQLTGPGQVVLHDRPCRRLVELDEPLQLSTDALGPVGDGVRGLHGALPAVAGVPDHPGGPACQHDRTVSGLLESAQREQRNEVAGVQAGRGRVESRIDRERPVGERVRQRVPVGRLRDQAAPFQLIEDAVTHPAIILYQSLPPVPEPADCADTPTPRGDPEARTARPDPPRCSPRPSVPRSRSTGVPSSRRIGAGRVEQVDPVVFHALFRGPSTDFPGRAPALGAGIKPRRSRATGSPSSMTAARNSTAAAASSQPHDHIGAHMDAVAAVGVHPAGRAEHHGVAQPRSAKRVRRRIGPGPSGGPP